MSFDLFEIACDQRAEARALASAYVARYGADALSLARMARADVVERGRHARAELYEQAISLLALSVVDYHDTRCAPSKLRTTISDTLQVTPRNERRYSQQRAQRLLQRLPVQAFCS